MLEITLASVLFTAFLLESIFGFGGTVLSLALLGVLLKNQMPVYDLLMVLLMTTSAASLGILFSDLKNFAYQKYGKIMLYSIPGVIIGAELSQVITGTLLLKIFAIIIIAYVIKSWLSEDFKLSFIMRRVFMLCGGILHGIYAAGGPLTLVGCRRLFDHKSELRATMAAFFLSCNLWRIGQLALTDRLPSEPFVTFWWLVPIILVGIYIGLHIHVKLNEAMFKKGMLITLFIASCVLLIQH